MMWTSKPCIVKFDSVSTTSRYGDKHIPPAYAIGRRKWFTWKYLRINSIQSNGFNQEKYPLGEFWNIEQAVSTGNCFRKSLSDVQETLTQYIELIEADKDKKKYTFNRIFLFGWLQPHGQKMDRAEIAQEIITG